MWKELRQQLTKTVAELYDSGLITPTGGNVSVRLPDNAGFLITPSGMYKGALRPEDMVQLDATGNPVEAGKRPSMETIMHLKIYELRPQCNAVIHTHAPWATLFGLLGMKMQPITIDAVRFLDMPLVPFRLPGTKELMEAVAEHITPCQALLLQNHGLVTYGSDLRDAANVALALEEVCRLLLECRRMQAEPAVIPEQGVALLQQFLLK